MGWEAAQLPVEATHGHRAAAARLTPLIYDELRELAHQYLPQREDAGAVTLQPTALMHEAFLRLVNAKTTDLKSQTHFYALAAVAMRHVLIDHARGRRRLKRGAG